MLLDHLATRDLATPEGAHSPVGNPLPSPEETSALAQQLIAELAEHIGSERDVRTSLNAWFTELGADVLALVGLAALRDTFALHMRHVPTREMSADAITLDAPEGAPTDA